MRSVPGFASGKQIDVNTDPKNPEVDVRQLTKRIASHIDHVPEGFGTYTEVYRFEERKPVSSAELLYLPFAEDLIRGECAGRRRMERGGSFFG